MLGSALPETIDSSVRFVHEGQVSNSMAHNDQAGFAKAIAEAAFQPAVLPINWNLRRKSGMSFFGPVCIWHDYEAVPPAVLEVNRYYLSDAAIIQYHEFEKVTKGNSDHLARSVGHLTQSLAPYFRTSPRDYARISSAAPQKNSACFGIIGG